MSKISTAGKIAGAVGLAAGVAAAAGYYFYGKGGKDRRKKATAWVLEAKTEILKKVQQMKDVTEEAYNKIVDEVLKKYRQAKNIDLKELEKFGVELKTHWKEISQEAAKLINKPAAKKSAVKN